MANKKSNKISSTKKKVSNKKKIQEENAKKIESVSEGNVDYFHVFLVASAIIIIFFVFYILTVYITGKNGTTKKTTSSEATISYTDTIAGRSFSMPENEYLVFYYDKTDTELYDEVSTLVSDYRSDENHYALYSVDMSSAINQTYLSEESNDHPSSVSELAISGPTLIHMKEGNVVEYIEGLDSIKDYLG